jgi:S1-C subfamily serine protease
MLALAFLSLTAADVKTIDSREFPPALQVRAITATVRVVNPTNRGEGTGVLIKRERAFLYILTANHLLGKAQRMEVQTFSSATYPARDKVYQAEILARDPRADLAVLRVLTRDTPPALLALAPAPPAALGKEFPALAVGCQPEGPSAAVEVVRGARSVRKPGEDGKTLCWELNQGQPPGWSGGPLVDRSGLLIGIASGANNGKGYYVHPREIHDFLRRQALDWLAEDGKQP